MDFFGILCPGILLMINIQVLLYACNIDISQHIVPISKIECDTFFAIIFFVLCYLLGFILRLISPDFVDKTSSIYLKMINPFCFFRKRKLLKDLNILKSKKEERDKVLNDHFNNLINEGKKLPKFFWGEENYPYYIGNKYIYKKYLPSDYFILIESEKLYNKNNYNFWKILLTHKNANSASLIFQAEASVRFLAGSFWALLIGIFSGIVLVIQNTKSHGNIGYVIIILYLLLVLVILSKFKNQRRREVKMLLDSIIILKDELEDKKSTIVNS